MALDTSDFWNVVEDPETVTYYVRATTSTFADPVIVENAKKRAASKSEVLASGLLGKVVLIWHLWKNQLVDITPKVNDKLVDEDEKVWSVKEVEIQSFGNRFRLTCIEERE